MSMDRCNPCGEPVDTDVDTDFYIEGPNNECRGVCETCRETESVACPECGEYSAPFKVKDSKAEFLCECKTHFWIKTDCEFVPQTLSVPCRLCAERTFTVFIKLCNDCWELETRIYRHPDIARQILHNIHKEKDA